MSNHWQKSQIPYFAVLQDNSSIRQSAFSISKPNASNESQVYSVSSLAPVLDSPNSTYPEIEYVFQDDPNYATLESQINNTEEGLEEEEAIIIELDPKGEFVNRYCSLSTQLQILGVRLKDRNLTKTIEVDATRSAISGIENLKDSGNLDYIKKLGELFTLRNEQLKDIMNQK